MSRKAVEPTQRPIRCVPALIRGGKQAGDVKLSIYLHLALILRMRGAMPLITQYVSVTCTGNTHFGFRKRKTSVWYILIVSCYKTIFTSRDINLPQRHK
jgi:hypothetical protein